MCGYNMRERLRLSMAHPALRGAFEALRLQVRTDEVEVIQANRPCLRTHLADWTANNNTYMEAVSSAGIFLEALGARRIREFPHSWISNKSANTVCHETIAAIKAGKSNISPDAINRSELILNCICIPH